MAYFTLQNYLTQVQSLLHDTTNVQWSQAEMIARINDARDDVANDAHCVRTVKVNVQLIQGQEIYPAPGFSLPGAIGGATITAGGAGLPASPTVVFDAAPAGGITALATGAATSGVLTSITMTRWGAGYTSVPNVTINGGVGGAAATAVHFLNFITIVSLTNIWNTMRYTLSFRSFGIYQAWLRMQQPAQFQSTPGVWTIHPGDQNVYINPPPNQTYFSEWDIISSSTALVNTTDVDKQVTPPYAQAVQFKAAEYLITKHQNYGQAQYFEGKYIRRLPAFIAGAGGVRVPNPYNKSAWMKMRRT